MSCLNQHPDRCGRAHHWAGAGLLLASALLLGCGGGGGSPAPAKLTFTTGLYEGTLTLQDSTQLTVMAVLLADSDKAGTVRLVTTDLTGAIAPYQFSGAITLNGASVTSNGSVTVFAPAGTTFNGSATTTCTLSGTASEDALSGTLSGPTFNGTFTITEVDEPPTSLSSAAGSYQTTFPFFSDGKDGTLTLAADGTFTGKSYPRGTLLFNPTPDPATAIGSLSNGTAQFVTGSQNILRINATALDGTGTPDPSGYSGLAVLADYNGRTNIVFMADNGSKSLAGTFTRR